MKLLAWVKEIFDWEKFGFQTTLECGEVQQAIEICGLELHAYSDELKPKLSSLNSNLEHNQQHKKALGEHLYDRPIPISDAAMLMHSHKTVIYLVLALAALAGSFASNLMMFLRMGWDVIWSLLAAFAIPAIPLAFGHPFYEKFVVGRRHVERIYILIVMLFVVGALYRFGQARQATADASTSDAGSQSYVDDPLTTNALAVPSAPDTETRVNGTLGNALFLGSIAAELSLGLLVGLYIEKRTDEDYAAWTALKALNLRTQEIEAEIAGLLALIEVAKKRCMAGIRRAENIKKKRRTPYYKAIAGLIFLPLIAPLPLHSQTVEHEDAFLIDNSRSIGSGREKGDLLQEYLHGVKKLLATEPPNSRVWVSIIGKDSFGGEREILRGFTPDARGIFVDNLNRARSQLVVSFETKSSGLTASEDGTDIFGALWRVKAALDSAQSNSTSTQPSQTIWIFSDMMNETKEFPMRRLLALGPERIMERAEGSGLVVPLPHCKMNVVGASTVGLTPQQWMAIKRFWEIYFTAAGAELGSYSNDGDAR